MERKTAPICGNAPTHTLPGYSTEEHGLKVMNPIHIKNVLLPPNVTSHVQPLDQGIVAAFKAHYRRCFSLVRWIVQEAKKSENADTNLSDMKPSFYHMMEWCHRAWTKDVSRETNHNCWCQSKIMPGSWSAHNAVQQAVAQVTAVEQLQEELTTLSERAGDRIADSEFVSAVQFFELDGEAQTEEGLSDAQIVQMVSTQDVDTPEVDDDQPEPVVVMNTTIDQAMAHALKLKERMLHHSNLYGMDVCYQIDEV